MPKRTGRPPIPERDLHKQQRVALVVTGDTFNQLLVEAEKRDTSIGAEASRLVRRAIDLEDVFGERKGEKGLNDVQVMNRVIAGGISLARDTGDPRAFEVALGDIAGRLWGLHPTKDNEARRRVLWELVRALDIDLPELDDLVKKGLAA